mmetsp:Transcript_35148/g.57745  ORF Transcript_35148/g.57745 Transcript_35148/m.57745 type:complete len:143 (-) Transcript_35148:613-1041(-)
MRGTAVTRSLVEQAHVQVALDQHLVEQRGRQAFGLGAGLLRIRTDEVHHATEILRRLTILSLAQTQCLALGCQRAAVRFPGQFFGSRLGGCFGIAGRFGPLRRQNGDFRLQRQVTFRRTPAHLGQAQATQDQQLIAGRDLEA